jgi:endogenous inhibitor of DNA gyrase (YacG/DUF329 family)
MSSVMIRCPITGRPVSTEIEIEPSVFRQLPDMRARMHCPACGRDHDWRVSDAWLAGEVPLVRPVPAAGTQAA